MNLLMQYLLAFIDLFVFWEVIDHYERGVLLRLGKPRNKIMEPGLHFIIPFGVDRAITDNIKVLTEDLGVQSLTTLDDIEVSLRAIVTWEIEDIKTILMEVEDADSVLEDTVAGMIGQMVQENNWEDINEPSFSKRVTRKAKTQAKKLGMKIVRVQFREMTTATTYRLMGDTDGAVLEE